MNMVSCPLKVGYSIRDINILSPKYLNAEHLQKIVSLRLYYNACLKEAQIL